MQKNLLVIGVVWPEPKSSAAGSRMLQLINIFLSKGYQITFATTANKTERSEDLKALGVAEQPIALNHPSFDDFIDRLKPDVVLFDRFLTEEQFGWRVSQRCPEALLILDTEDLHFLRKGRQQAFKDEAKFTNEYLFNETAIREVASILRCDLSLIISEAEVLLLQEKFKIDAQLLYYLPFLLEPMPESYFSGLPKYGNRNHFITVGTFLHEPNYQAVLKLKTTIWPQIKQRLPKAELHVYGAHASQKVTQLHNEKQGFLIKGFVDDIHSTMAAHKVCLAPLPFGAGLKGKLIDAMRNGTPCVMSPIAAEGMFGNYQPNGFICDNDTDFVQKAVELYTQEACWNRFSENGVLVLKERFFSPIFTEAFFMHLTQLQQTLKQHRQQNFMGNMLRHHYHQSTKFKAKWIEAKNKNA